MFVCQSLGNGGAERVVSVLSRALDKKLYKIYILAMTGTEVAYQLDPNVRILLPSSEIADGVRGKLQRIAAIRKHVRKEKIDTVIAFSHYNAMFAVLACMGLKVRIIGSERNDPAQIQDRKVLNTMRSILYRRLDCLVCQTNDAKAYFSEAIQRKSVIILNPITSGLPDPWTGERDHRIVTFCRLNAQKNLPMLIDAFEIFHRVHSDYQLEIYGNGEEKEKLEKLIRSKKLENAIYLHPFCRDIHSRVRSAAAFALSSDYEGLSNSMIEAMAIGLPVAVTDCPCGGARMVIEHGVNGLLVTVGDAQAMSQAISSIIDDHELAACLSGEAVKIRQKLDEKQIAEQWADILKQY